MNPSSKVVQLNATEGAKAQRRAGLPPILQSVRQASRKQLSLVLQDVFNQVDDTLFELADRSRSDADQNMYFDSMRQLRLHRKQILEDYARRLNLAFEAPFQSARKDDEGTSQQGSADDLTLMDSDALEIDVAISAVAGKINARHALPLMQFKQRMDSLNPQHELAENESPLGPKVLAKAFADVLKRVELALKIRLILLKLFERVLLERHGGCLEEANRMLAEAGVLAKLPARSESRDDTASGRAPATGQTRSESRTESSLGADLPNGWSARPVNPDSMAEGGIADFSSLQHLLAAQRSAGPQAPLTHAVTGVPGGTIYNTPQLLTLIDAVQSDQTREPIDVSHAPATISLGQVLVGRAESATGQQLGGLERTDEDTVNLVGMLFDFILNDRNLAIPMKALIGRLQFPILKVAVLDKAFFSKPSHPARQLLNELSSAGIGWSGGAELKRDALYNKIESVVLRVLNNFGEDLKLYNELVTELRAFVTQDRSRTERIEQRVRESETGKAKTLAAKQSVEQLINQKASGLRLPPPVSRFISESWSRVLVFVCVKHGNQHAAWTGNVQLLDDLLWAVQPLDNRADVERRDSATAALLDGLREGLSLVNITGQEADALIEPIRESLEDISRYDRGFLDDDLQAQPEFDDERRPVMEEIVLTAPGEKQDADELADVEPEPEMVAQINKVTEGVWVEFTHDNGEKLRCKLATIVQPGNRYIFVNRRGMKVAERNRMALAVELKRQTLAVLDESQVFDRALQAVIGNLRQMQRKPG